MVGAVRRSWFDVLGLETVNRELRTPNAERRTPNVERRTSNDI